MLAVRNTTRYSPPLFEPPAGAKHDWEIFLELATRLAGSSGLKGRAVGLDSWGKLTLGHADADAALERDLGAIAGGRLESVQGAFRIPSEEGAPGYLASLVPFMPHRETEGFAGSFLPDGVPVAMLTVVDPQAASRPSRRWLRQLYGLTEAEIALAESLLAGEDVSGYAERKAISVHTVRTQLKSVLAKTETRRQGELIALMSRLSAL